MLHFEPGYAKGTNTSQCHESVVGQGNESFRYWRPVSRVSTLPLPDEHQPSMDDQPPNATEYTYSPTTRLATSSLDWNAQLERDTGTHRRRLIFVWMLPFLKANNLAPLCRTSRDICTLTRADLFRRVVLKIEEAADAFCRTINEDIVIPACAHYEGADGRRLL